MHSDLLRKGLSLAALLFLTSGALAQTPSILLRDGDLIPNTPQERIRSIFRADVNDTGGWFALAYSDLPDAQRDDLLLLQGLVLQREGDPLAALGQGEIQSWWDVSFNDVGEIALSIHARNTVGQNKALFVGNDLIARGGNPVEDPRVGQTVNYRYFYTSEINEAGQVLSVTALDDTTRPGSADSRALVLFTPDELAPGTFATDVLVYLDDPIPGVGQTVFDLGLFRGTFNDAGDVLYSVQIDTTSLNAALVLNDTLLARDGTPSPIAGRNYRRLIEANPDLNDRGEYVFVSGLNGDPDTDAFIQKNEEVIVQKGDRLDSLTARVLDFPGLQPALISDSGDVYWRAGLNSHEVRNEALMRNEEVVLRKRDLVGSERVVGIHRWNISDSGRFLIADVDLAGGDEALVLADLGTVVPVLGCDTNEGELTLESGTANTGNTLTFTMENAQALGVTPLLFFSTGLLPLDPCGAMGPWGELLIQLGTGNPVGRKVGTPWDGTPQQLPLTIPADPSLVDVIVYAQGVFVDVGGPEQLRATNGLRIEVGAP